VKALCLTMQEGLCFICIQCFYFSPSKIETQEGFSNLISIMSTIGRREICIVLFLFFGGYFWALKQHMKEMKLDLPLRNFFRNTYVIFSL